MGKVKPVDFPLAEVAAKLEYNPSTGTIVWKTGHRRGLEAGCSRSTHGYRTIGLNGRMVGAHRVAWLLHFGEWPESPVDHINRDRLDNRIANLRQATLSENTFNAGVRKNNKSGYPGIYWDKQLKHWRVQIRLGGRSIHVGLFKQIDDAVAARVEAERAHPSAQFMPFQNSLKEMVYG